MLRRLLEWFQSDLVGGDSPQPSEIDLLVEERKRLAESLASYREFGFDVQSEGCKDRLRRVQARIRELRGSPERSSSEPGRIGE